MSKDLRSISETNMQQLYGKLLSGCVVGLGETGLPMQVIWQPKRDNAGNSYSLVRSNESTHQWQQQALQYTEVKTLIHYQNSHEAREAVNIGRVERRGLALHLATINFAGKSLLDRLAATETHLSRKITYEEFDEHSEQLGRYATALVNLPLGIPSSAVGNAALIQLVSRGPDTPPSLGRHRLAPSMRALYSLLKDNFLELGVGVGLDEYSASPLPIETYLPLYEDAATTAAQYKKWLGPTIDGAVKEIGAGRQQVVLFSEVAD